MPHIAGQLTSLELSSSEISELTKLDPRFIEDYQLLKDNLLIIAEYLDNITGIGVVDNLLGSGDSTNALSANQGFQLDQDKYDKTGGTITGTVEISEPAVQLRMISTTVGADNTLSSTDSAGGTSGFLQFDTDITREVRLTSTSTDGLSSATLDMRYTDWLRFNGYHVERFVPVPAAGNSLGSIGHMSADSSYIYICIATNTWVRSAAATW